MKVLVDTSVWSLALRKKTLATQEKRIVEELKDEFIREGFKPAIVEEYPTQDCFPVEVEFL